MLKIKFELNEFQMLLKNMCDIYLPDVIVEDLCNRIYHADVTASVEVSLQDLICNIDVFECNDDHVFYKWVHDEYPDLTDRLIFKYFIDKYLPNDLSVMALFGGMESYDSMDADAVNRHIFSNDLRETLIPLIFDAINRENINNNTMYTWVYESDSCILCFMRDIALLGLY